MALRVRLGLSCLLVATLPLLAAGCGDDDDTPAVDSGPGGDGGGDGGTDGGTGFAVLNPFLPAVPAPTGGARVTFAEEITTANRTTTLIPGLASRGAVGDWSLRNDKIRLVIQKPGRVFGPIPSGGNLIDADLVRASGPGNDQFGEITTWFNVGRYPVFDQCSVLQDGAGGGAAAIRCFGHADVLEFINVPGMLWEFSSGLHTALMNLKLNDPIDFVTAVTYTLEPGASHVLIDWTFYNPQATLDYKAHVGSYIDTGAVIEPFSPYWGFGPVGISDTLKLVGGPDPVRSWGFQSAGVAYGYAPLEIKDVDMDTVNKMPIKKSAVFTISGLNVSAYTQQNGVTGLANKPFHLPGLGGGNVRGAFAIATDVGQTSGILSKVMGSPVGHVTGVVSQGGTPQVGARVAFTVPKPDAMGVMVPKVFATFITDANGRYDGDIEVGDYMVTADQFGFPRMAATALTVTANGMHTQNLTVGQTGQISVNVMDDTGGGAGVATPCKVSIVGNNTNETDSMFRDTRFDPRPAGIVLQEPLSTCSKTFFVRPGTYRVVVSRGNEWTIRDVVAVVNPGGAPTPVSGNIRKVVNTGGWISADFHQHAINSHDSPMTSEFKVISYVAEGLEYFVSSEHDFVYDYMADIVNTNNQGKIGFAPGIETSPIDYGHFNFIDVRPDSSLNGGAVDWGSPTAFNLTPQQILDNAAAKGVTVRISAHPRADASNTLFNYFDRMGLTYNEAARTFGGDLTKMPVAPALLHLPEGAQLFSKSFEAMEIMNSNKFICLEPLNSTSCPSGSRQFDYVVDEVLKDYMNFLSYGFLLSIVGDSDSHKLMEEQNGFPRTYVFVGAGKDVPSSATLTADVKAGLLPQASMNRIAGATLATNGPFVTAFVTGSGGGPNNTGGSGQLVDDADGAVSLQIHIEAPSWIEYDRVEVFANNTYRNDQFVSSMVRESRQRTEPPLTASMAYCNGAGCSGALPKDTSVAGLATTDLTVPISFGANKDGWIIVRVTGQKPLYPVIPRDARFAPGDAVTTPSGPESGTPAMAITGAVFVNANGMAGYQGILQP